MTSKKPFPEQPAARPIQIIIKHITIESNKPDTPTTTPPCKKRTAPKMLIMIETKFSGLQQYRRQKNVEIVENP